MQIPSSTGAYTSNVLPVAQAQGGLLSPISETAGSASFPPVEAVPNVIASRDIPSKRPLPDFSPENNGLVNTTSPQGSSSNTSIESGISSENGSDEVQSAESQEGQEANQQSDRINNETDQKQARQDQQQQQDLDIIRELTLRNGEVRAHEQAHSAIGGQYAGSANYSYQRGPDGVNYAVGGEVSIDVSVIEGDPQATLEKMQLVQRAALAPAEPSSQDRQVAALAAQQANQARAELASQSLGTADSSTQNGQNTANNGIEPVVNESAQTISSRDNSQVFSDRIAKINEILLAVGQNQALKASGQLLDDVV